MNQSFSLFLILLVHGSFIKENDLNQNLSNLCVKVTEEMVKSFHTSISYFSLYNKTVKIIIDEIIGILISYKHKKKFLYTNDTKKDDYGKFKVC